MRILIVEDGKALASQLATALNAQAAALPEGCEAFALNFELPADGSVPDVLELIPPGEVVTGRDGRTWINDRPDGIIEMFSQDGRDIPVDWEHATELQAPQGNPAPAAAWIKGLEVREGNAIFGLPLEWTPRGRESVSNREYRYLSPVFIYETATLRIRAIRSVGLTNKPNLFVPALNSEHTKTEVNPMLLGKILALLALPATTTEEAALNHISTIKGDLTTALNQAQNPPLDKFVPRADYDKVVEKATNAEQSLADKTKADLATAINTEIDAALKAGKITPATVDYHKASCQQEGGLDRFREFVKAAPTVAGDTGLDDKDPNRDRTALNAEEKKICEMMGISEEDYLKTNK